MKPSRRTAYAVNVTALPARRLIVEGTIRTDATFFPGFSGGGVVDPAGRMLGLATSYREHAAIAAALIRGRGARAADLVRRHLEYGRAMLLGGTPEKQPD